MPFPTGVLLAPSLYFRPFMRHLHPNVSGSQLYLSGSRDVTGHVTIWYPRCHSYRCSIVTKSGITTLFFLGHVTSSVTWPYAISYWYPISVFNRLQHSTQNPVRPRRYTHRHTHTHTPQVVFITARCTVVQSAVLRSHVVCLSVCLSVCLWRWWIVIT